MKLNEYQKHAESTAQYPDDEGLYYTALGLAGEAGEYCDKLKKVIRDQDGNLTECRREALMKELGDVLWYVANAAAELGYKLENVAEANLSKLFDRKERGVIKGSGDNR